MRDYDEVTQTVLRRRDELIARDRRRALILKRSGVAALSVCAAAVVGIGVFRMNSKDIELPDDGGIIVAETTAPPVSTYVTASAVTTHGTAAARTTAASVKDTVTSAHVSVTAAATTAAANTVNTVVHSTKSQNGTAAAAVSSSIPQTTAAAPAVVTTVTTTMINPERSVDMKRLMPFTASLVMMANAAAPSGAAAAETYNDYTIMTEMDNGDLDIDIDKDGEFTVKDCFYLMAYDYRHEPDEAVRNNILEIADYDRDGKVGHNDADVLLKYFIGERKVKKEHLFTDYYADFDIVYNENGKPIYGPADPELKEKIDALELEYDKSKHTYEELEEIKAEYDELMEKYNEQMNDPVIVGYEQVEYRFSDIFVSNLRNYVCCEPFSTSTFFGNCIKDGDIDMDIDGDGSFTFDDVAMYYLYEHERDTRYRYKSDDPFVDFSAYTDRAEGDPIEMYIPDNVTSLTEAQWNKCAEIYSLLTETLGMRTVVGAALYYLYERDGEPDVKYFENEHYDALFPLGERFRFGEYVRMSYSQLYQVDERLTYDELNIHCTMNEYLDDIAAGRKEPVDINEDGSIDYKDVLVSDIFLYEYKNKISDKESCLPTFIKSNFMVWLDLNENTISGDLNDVTMYQFSVYVYRESVLGDETPLFSDDKEYYEYIAEYRRELTEQKLGRKVDVQPAPVMVESNVSNALQDTDAERSGDSNCDGNTDLADAIFIMQSIANPDKYRLGIAGRFNGDVCETGGGITSNDALTIQNGLLTGKY